MTATLPPLPDVVIDDGSARYFSLSQMTAYALAAIAAQAQPATAVAPPEPMARFCPGCGSVGDVPKDKFRDCCPDGARARAIPVKLARQCHDLFRMAVDSATAVRPDPTVTPAVQALIAAACEWSAERSIKDWDEADLMKAVATYSGDWAGCEGCDFECDEPCIPATVADMHKAIDFRLARLVHEGKLGAHIGYTPPQGWTPMYFKPTRAAPAAQPAQPTPSSPASIAYLLTRPSGFSWAAVPRELSPVVREMLLKDNVKIEPLYAHSAPAGSAAGQGLRMSEEQAAALVIDTVAMAEGARESLI